MYNTHSYRLTKEQYNFLLPVLRSKLCYTHKGIRFKDGRVDDMFSFIGTEEEFKDALERCLYLDMDLLDSNITYKDRLDYNERYNSGVCCLSSFYFLVPTCNYKHL